MAISDLIKKIDLKKQELDSLGSFDPKDEKRLWEKLRLEWNYNSNHIEGNTLTYGETKLLLLFGQTNGNHNVRDLDEMRAHDVAIQLIRNWAKDENYTLNERDIRDLNRTILVQDFWKEAITQTGQSTRRKIKVGNYKEHPNSVITQTGEIFEYASVTDTPILMQELIDWYRNETSEMHPVTVAAMLHYRFVRIHPFDDGNGRISRILLNFHLLKNGFPPIVIKSTDKKNYLLALNRADAGDLDSFVEYVGEEMLWSLDLNIKAGKGESIEEEVDWEKEVFLLEKKIKAVKNHDENIKKQINQYLTHSFPIILKRFVEKMNTLSSFFEENSLWIGCKKIRFYFQNSEPTDIKLKKLEEALNDFKSKLKNAPAHNSIVLEVDYEFKNMRDLNVTESPFSSGFKLEVFENAIAFGPSTQRLENISDYKDWLRKAIPSNGIDEEFELIDKLAKETLIDIQKYIKY